MSWLRSLCGV